MFETGNTTTSQMSQRELSLRFLTRTRMELAQMRACLPDTKLPIEPLAMAHLEKMAAKTSSAAEAFGFPEIGVIAGAIGAAIACFEEAVSYAKNRIMFDRPIGGFQIQQERLAEMLTEIVKAQLVSLHLGRMKDAGTFTPQQVSFAKRNNVNIATDIAREARRLLGGNGIVAEYASMRHMANLESVYTYEGTHDIHSLILGQAVTGMNAFGG